MIQRSNSFWQTSDWQNALKSMIRDTDELLQAVALKKNQLPPWLQSSIAAAKDFELKAPRHYVSQIEKGNPLDPLLLQILPQAQELNEQIGFSEDPLAEKEFNAAFGLVHKYPGRVLLISNPSCAIHCRYCFRRHFDYQANTPSSKGWQAALDYIDSDSTIHEVILSGGDPLSSNDSQLTALIKNINTISHVETLRIHSRIATIMPERITNELLNLLSNNRLNVVMVLHINHANELSYDAVYAIEQLQQAGIRLLNQSVLLKNINDTVDRQVDLLKALHQIKVGAYYLHQLDTVKGAQHFAVRDHDALMLFQQLESLLPGYMLPKLVREIPQHQHKTALIETINIAQQLIATT